MSQTQLLYFDWEENGSKKTFALRAADLSSVATLCPFGRFPGLPPGVLGLVLWSGKVLPVIDLTPVLGQGFAHKMKEALAEGWAIFLFSGGGMPGAFPEVALALPSQVRVQQEAAAVEILDLKRLCLELCRGEERGAREAA